MNTMCNGQQSTKTKRIKGVAQLNQKIFKTRLQQIACWTLKYNTSTIPSVKYIVFVVVSVNGLNAR